MWCGWSPVRLFLCAPAARRLFLAPTRLTRPDSPGQDGGGIVISGLPAALAAHNGTYVPTGQLVEGYPAYAACPDRHLFRHPKVDQWYLTNEPFDPAKATGIAHIAAASGPVLTRGLLTQGVPGVPQDPLTPRRGPLQIGKAP